MDKLISDLEKATARKSSTRKKPKSKPRSSGKPRKPRKPKIVFRTRVKTIVKRVRVFVHKHTASKPRKKRASKPKPGKKLSKAQKREIFLKNMAKGRRAAKRARKH